MGSAKKTKDYSTDLVVVLFGERIKKNRMLQQSSDLGLVSFRFDKLSTYNR